MSKEQELIRKTKEKARWKCRFGKWHKGYPPLNCDCNKNEVICPEKPN